MGLNHDNPCPVCKSIHSLNYIGLLWTCTECGNIFDNRKKEWKKTKPQNLPKADTYSLLSEVRAMKREIYIQREQSTSDAYDNGFNHAIDKVIEKLSEHFS